MLVTAQARGAHPMLALNLFRSRTFTVVIVVGFTFMACYYGLPFVMSLDLQQVKGLTGLQTGLVFVPMMLHRRHAARPADRRGPRARHRLDHPRFPDAIEPPPAVRDTLT